MKKLLSQWFVALLAGLILSTSATAAPVDVTVTQSGSAGNWVLNFSLTNNLDTLSGIYFFGVALDDRNIGGAPARFNPNAWTSWSNAPYGGSSVDYNNNWIDSSLVGFKGALDGFIVVSTALIAPTDIHWFAAAYNGNWTGGGNVNTSTNPIFEGIVDQTAVVPEPASAALILAGLLGIGVARRRRA